jgi:hypothetical protein
MAGKEGATNAEDTVVTHRFVMLEMKGRNSCLQHVHGKLVHSSSRRKLLLRIKCLSTSHRPSPRKTVHEIEEQLGCGSGGEQGIRLIEVLDVARQAVRGPKRLGEEFQCASMILVSYRPQWQRLPRNHDGFLEACSAA